VSFFSGDYAIDVNYDSSELPEEDSEKDLFCGSDKYVKVKFKLHVTLEGEEDFQTVTKLLLTIINIFVLIRSYVSLLGFTLLFPIKFSVHQSFLKICHIPLKKGGAGRKWPKL